MSCAGSPFPTGDYARRCRQIQTAMATENLDVLLLTSEAEHFYFTGFRTPFWQSSTRPWYLLIPAAGRPIAVVPTIGAALYRQCFVGAVITFDSPHPQCEGVCELADTILQCPLPHRTIGTMQGRQSYLRMTAQDHAALQETLTNTHAGLQWVDCTQMLHAQRQIKSASEIAHIATACMRVGEVFAQLPAWVQAGQTPHNIHRQFKIRCLQAGVDDVNYLVGGVGYTDVISLPSATPLAHGDLLMLDVGATVNGYYCDFCRNFAIGGCSDETLHAHETLWHATAAGIAAARPGVACAQVFTAMHAVIVAAGYADAADAQQDIGRYGHGIGIDLTETPSLCSWDTTPLAEGMTLAIEPSLWYNAGGERRLMVHEENISITATGAQLLTPRTPKEMPHIS